MTETSCKIPPELVEQWRKAAWEIISPPFHRYSDSVFQTACRVIRQHGMPQ